MSAVMAESLWLLVQSSSDCAGISGSGFSLLMKDAFRLVVESVFKLASSDSIGSKNISNNRQTLMSVGNVIKLTIQQK